MSKPKKPGTDLAALKARLAKKTQGNEPDAAGAAADVPPPGHVAAPMPEVPPPGQVAEVPPPGHVAPPAPEVPPPGQMMADVPPPGQQVVQHYEAAPTYQAPAAPPPQQTSGDPFGGSNLGGFDPDAGLFDSGPEIKPRGGKGIVIFAAVLAAGIGGAGGWLGHKISSTQEKIDSGRAKGERMVEQVEKISDARKSVSLAMEDLKKEVAQDPSAAAETVTNLLTTSFDKQPQISELFGWQLASVDPAGVKATFQLYEQVTDLQMNLSLMAKVLQGYGNVMKVGGPSLYGVTFGPSGAQMVAISDALCGAAPPPPAEGGGGEEGAEAPAAPSAEGLKPCGADAGKAVAYKVNDFNGETIMPRGNGPGQAMLLLAEGKVYDYAVGIEQGNNAANFYKMALSRVEESLGEMNKAEEKALAALKKYAEDPDVDGSKVSNEE